MSKEKSISSITFTISMLIFSTNMDLQFEDGLKIRTTQWKHPKHHVLPAI